ncbi:kinase-like domain-containing protein [Coprinopsis sp. MPI-PUGE-AT-0042]|nr:kinase-like domain-containing protein [Coprinopsis sp. MPI-PUGE-AT-0042]
MPNYIALEVLFDATNSHNFKVDIWSIGVIFFTLSMGWPPFQTKDVKDICKRIRDNEYEFRIERPITSAARCPIQSILAPDPSQRSTFHEIVAAQSFTQGLVPAFIPTSAHDAPPTFATSLAARATRTSDGFRGVSCWTWSLRPQHACDSRREISLHAYAAIHAQKKT